MEDRCSIRKKFHDTRDDGGQMVDKYDEGRRLPRIRVAGGQRLVGRYRFRCEECSAAVMAASLLTDETLTLENLAVWRISRPVKLLERHGVHR